MLAVRLHITRDNYNPQGLFMPRTAHTSVPINPVLAARWSPRSYDTTAVLTPADLAPAFEAARWAPSANNSQPWRFIAGFRGDATFETIAGTLAGWNSAWAPTASALVVAIAQTAGPDGTPNPYGLYDLGQAVAHFSVQAQTDGLYVHQMAGTDTEALKHAFNLPAGFEAFVAFSVGKLGPADALPEALAEREVAPRVRHELAEIVRYDAFQD
jgi:nitroreductase